MSWWSFSPSHSTVCSTRLRRIPFQRYFQQVSRANSLPIRPTSPQGSTLSSVWDVRPTQGYLRFRSILYQSRKLWVLPPSHLQSSPVQIQHWSQGLRGACSGKPPAHQSPKCHHPQARQVSKASWEGTYSVGHKSGLTLWQSLFPAKRHSSDWITVL